MSSISTAMPNGSSARPTAERGVAAGVAEHLHEQVGAAVDHGGGLVETGRDVDHAEHLDDALDAVEVAELGVERREDRERGHPRRPAAVVEREVATDLAAHDVGAVDRTVPADVHDAVVDDTAEIVGGGREHRRQHDAERFEPFRDHAAAYAAASAFVLTPQYMTSDATSALYSRAVPCFAWTPSR